MQNQQHMGLCFSTSRDALVVDNNSTMPVDFFTCCAHSTDLDSSGLITLALESVIGMRETLSIIA